MVFKDIELGHEFLVNNELFVKINPGLARMSSSQNIKKYLYSPFLPNSPVEPYLNLNKFPNYFSSN